MTRALIVTLLIFAGCAIDPPISAASTRIAVPVAAKTPVNPSDKDPPLVRTLSVDPIDIGCSPDAPDRRSDLCAQWKAADAASASARWSLWQVILGGLAILVGIGTLVAAWRAAIYARDAASYTKTGADEAKRAANAAESALAHSKVISETQLRPYIVPGRMRYWLDEKSGLTAFKAKFYNVGQLPARDVEVTFGAVYKDIPAPEEWKAPFGIRLTFDIVAPSSPKSSIATTLAIDDERLGKIESLKGVALVELTISYKPFPDGETETITRRGMAIGSRTGGFIRVIQDYIYRPNLPPILEEDHDQAATE